MLCFLPQAQKCAQAGVEATNAPSNMMARAASKWIKWSLPSPCSKGCYGQMASPLLPVIPFIPMGLRQTMIPLSQNILSIAQPPTKLPTNRPSNGGASLGLLTPNTTPTSGCHYLNMPGVNILPQTFSNLRFHRICPLDGVPTSLTSGKQANPFTSLRI